VSSREVFSRIARRYDRLNRILSLGHDDDWRRSAVAHLPPGRVLDLGAGTGAANPDLGDREIVALDPSPEMLALNPLVRRVVGKGERLPFPDGWFDGVFSAYVVRNLDSIPDTLSEVARVLRPGGVAAIVEGGQTMNPSAQDILQALEATAWNKQAAAHRLGLHRPTLYSKMRRHGISAKRPSESS